MSTTGHRTPKAPVGQHWAWRPTSEVERNHQWEVLAPGDRAQPCRWGTRPGKDGCGQVPVARLNTASRDSWAQWAYYCGRHLFSRRITNGVLHTCVLVPDVGEAA